MHSMAMVLLLPFPEPSAACQPLRLWGRFCHAHTLSTCSLVSSLYIPQGSHIILWTLKETDADKKAEILANMKEHLEGLAGKVPGLLEVHVRTNPLASSNAEVMLDTTLENEEMLKGYQKHPAHVEVANTYVRPYTDVRMCMDYEV